MAFFFVLQTKFLYFVLQTQHQTNVHRKGNQMTPIVSLQSLSVKKQISPFSTCLGPAWNRHGSYIVLTLVIRLLGVDGPWLDKKLGISVLIKTGPAAKLLSRQQHNRCHFFSFVINISGAKFEEHCINISTDFLYSVFQCFSVHHSPNCIIQKYHSSLLWKPLQYYPELFFHFIVTLTLQNP